MTATFSLWTVNLRARKSREATTNSVRTERATRASGMISSFQRESGETQFQASPESLRTIPKIETGLPEPDVGEKWPVWKSATFLIGYCAIAWTFIGLAIWLLLR